MVAASMATRGTTGDRQLKSMIGDGCKHNEILQKT